MSIHWPIIRRLALSPRQVVMQDDTRSYRGLEVLVGAMHIARAIAARSRTDAVGLLIPTSGAFPMAALAGWMLGKTIVPINYLLRPEEMSHIIRDCGCDTIVTVQPLLDHLGDGWTSIAGAGPSTAAPQGVSPDTRPSALTLPWPVRHILKLNELTFKGFPPLRLPARPANDQLAVLLYTSGTSGKPKGVMLSHGNIASNIRQIQEWVHFTPGKDVMFGVLPQFHTFGLTVLSLLPLTCGLKVIYTARFVPGRIVKLLREHKPTVLVAIPSMFNALLHAKDAKPEDFKGIRYLVSGGEPLPQVVFDTFRERFGATIAEGYGLTETSPVTNWCRPEEWKRGTVGKPLPRMDQKIIAIEGFDGGPGASPGKPADEHTWSELPAGQEGEIRMKGPNVMQGYFHLPDESAKAFDERGYFRTGDIGRLDEDGFLFITGRLKEMLIIGGENVFPREIEEVLNAHPAVKDSGVVGKKDPMRGELPVAFVELKESDRGPGASPGTDAGTHQCDTKQLIQWCRSKLAGYKVPDEIRVLNALPRNATGKVVRRDLKKLLDSQP